METAGDATRLSQALQNLLDNAIKYSPDSSMIRVDIRRVRGSVEVTLTDGSRVVEEIAVADAHPLGAWPFGREQYVAKFRTLADGVVSPEEGLARTELTYDPPALLMPLPLSEGASWTTDTAVTGLASGIFSIYSELYEGEADASGTAPGEGSEEK